MRQRLVGRFLSDSQRTLRLSGGLIAIGLSFEALTLYFNHPFSFMGFAVLSGGLVVVGLLLYLGTITFGDHQ